MNRLLPAIVSAGICIAVGGCGAAPALAASGGPTLPAEARAAISRALRADQESDLARRGGSTPRLSNATELTASDATVNDGFGWPVSISGDTIVVGSFANTVGPNTFQGAVYVFEKPPGGWASTSSFSAKLTASDGASGDWFGFSVSISGNTVVVGAPNASVGPNVEQGTAYVFTKPAGGWATTSAFDARLTASVGEMFDDFGLAVAISGDTMVSGAFGTKVGANTYQGAAYVFAKPAGGWATTSTFDARLTSSDGATWDALGASVAVSGDTVVTGAPSAAVGSNVEQGAAYVFVKPPNGWTTTSAFDSKLTAPDGAANDVFASSIAISGDTVAAGAIGALIGSNPHQGAVYLFVKPSGGWPAGPAFVAKLAARDGETYDNFGYSVAISGDRVLAGAPSARVGENPQQGTSYLFVKPPAGWATTSSFDQEFLAPDGRPVDGFGASVAISGDEIVVGLPADTKLPGSPGEDPPPALDPRFGAAYVFGPCEATGSGAEPCLEGLPPTHPVPVNGRRP